MKPSAPRLACIWLALAACATQLNLGRNEATETSEAGGSGNDADQHSADDANGAYTCDSVCARLVACTSVEPDERARCVVECNAAATANDRACVMNAPCATIAETCGLPSEEPDDGGADEFEIVVCQNACDGARFRECLAAGEHSNCRALCSSSAKAAREAFASCTQTGGTCDAIAECYAAFAN